MSSRKLKTEAGRQKKFVFLGPSLPLNEDKKLCPDAIFLPPARCGDVLEILKINPSHLLLIDGFFEAVPAIWHKEILFVMTKGLIVMGASSMGALRASELYPFGMQSIGQIAQWYSNGTITRDDEVAVLHLDKEHHYHSLTEPLVNARSTLNLTDLAFKHLQEQQYRERIWQEKTPAVNQKALDAKLALKTLHNCPSPRVGERKMMDVSLAFTLYFKALHQQVFCRAPTLPIEVLSENQRLLTQTRLFAPCYRELVRLAKLLYACHLMEAAINPDAKLAIKNFPPSSRWPNLNYPEWLTAIIAAQLPYKAFLYDYFHQQRWMPSMNELKRKLTAWQKEENAMTPEAVMAWLHANQYTQEEFEQALVFETLLDYMIDRGNVFLNFTNKDLPTIDFFAAAFDISQSEKFISCCTQPQKRNNITFLTDHQEDVGLLNALDFYQSEDLRNWLTSCG